MDLITSKGVIGMYIWLLSQAKPSPWLGDVSNYFPSNQKTETYPFLSFPPGLRVKGQALQPRRLKENNITITNEEYESTMEILTKDLRRDKTLQLQARILDHIKKTDTHWKKLLTTLIEDGETAICYDGQAFFDTDHAEGESGTQSNDIEYNVTTTTAPTAAEMELAIWAAISAIRSFKDDQGDPINEDALEFRVTVPQVFEGAAKAAINNTVIADGSGSRTNTLVADDETIVRLSVNSRLTWTTKFMVTRTDAPVKSFIRQEEVMPFVDALAEGSDYAKLNSAHLYIIETSRAVDYGYWQGSCLVTLT